MIEIARGISDSARWCHDDELMLLVMANNGEYGCGCDDGGVYDGDHAEKDDG